MCGILPFTISVRVCDLWGMVGAWLWWAMAWVGLTVRDFADTCKLVGFLMGATLGD